MVAILAIVAIITDRRALLVSTLVYFGIVIGYAITGTVGQQGADNTVICFRTTGRARCIRGSRSASAGNRCAAYYLRLLSPGFARRLPPPIAGCCMTPDSRILHPMTLDDLPLMRRCWLDMRLTSMNGGAQPEAELGLQSATWIDGRDTTRPVHLFGRRQTVSDYIVILVASATIRAPPGIAVHPLARRAACGTRRGVVFV